MSQWFSRGLVSGRLVEYRRSGEVALPASQIRPRDVASWFPGRRKRAASAMGARSGSLTSAETKLRPSAGLYWRDRAGLICLATRPG